MNLAGEQETPLTLCDDLAALLEEVLDATMKLQRADLGEVRLHDDATGTLEIVAHRGLGPAYIEHFAAEASSDTSACGRAFREGRRVVIEDVTTDPDYAPHRAVAASSGYRGVICTPLFERGGGKPIGILSTFFREPCRPAARDLQLADLFARQAADLITSHLVMRRLRDSEEHFRLALEAGNMGIWEWDEADRLIKADKAHQALFGLPVQDEPRAIEVYLARMEPEGSEAWTRMALNSLETGTDMQIELRVRPPAGSVRWIAVQGRPRNSGSGSIIGISFDITERRKREQDLREHQEWLAAILDQVPGAVGLFDRYGQLLLRGGPLGRMWDDLMPFRDPASIGRWRSFSPDGRLLPAGKYPGARALRGETVSPGMDFLYTDDAGEAWYRISAAPFRDEAGKIGGAVAILQNVDQEKRADERLRRSEARLKAAVDLVKLGLYSWDPVTNAMHWDATVKAMWGIPPEGPVLDWDLARAAIHRDDLARVDAAVADSVLPGGGGVYDIEYRVIGHDGVERWIATRGQTLFEDGRPVSFLGAALDITKRKMAESELEDRVEARTSQLGEVNAALISEIEERRQIASRLALIQAELYHAARLSVAGQMAATIAHEISQPLTAALNSVNAARRLPSSGDPGRDLALRELIEEAGGEIERASEIVRRLRFYIRRGSVDRVPEAVAPMVEEAIAFAAVGPNALGVNISQYYDPDAPQAMVDRVQIQQVIANLVRNALEAMSSQARRELTVATTARDHGQLELLVADSGPGIADELLANLFEPFLTTKPGGMGLGLSICKSIVEAHGGRIGYAPALNGGATFTFTLKAPPRRD